MWFYFGSFWPLYFCAKISFFLLKGWSKFQNRKKIKLQTIRKEEHHPFRRTKNDSRSHSSRGLVGWSDPKLCECDVKTFKPFLRTFVFPFCTDALECEQGLSRRVKTGKDVPHWMEHLFVLLFFTLINKWVKPHRKKPIINPRVSQKYLTVEWFHYLTRKRKTIILSLFQCLEYTDCSPVSAM